MLSPSNQISLQGQQFIHFTPQSIMGRGFPPLFFLVPIALFQYFFGYFFSTHFRDLALKYLDWVYTYRGVSGWVRLAPPTRFPYRVNSLYTFTLQSTMGWGFPPPTHSFFYLPPLHVIVTLHRHLCHFIKWATLILKHKHKRQDQQGQAHIHGEGTYHIRITSPR